MPSSGILHLGDCVPRYKKGDYVKVEFPDEMTGIGEWMWVRVDHCDESRELVFGLLDNDPINDSSGKLRLGKEIVIAYAQIREHKQGSEFEAGH